MIKDFHKTAIIAGNRYVSYKEMLRRITYFARYTSPHAGAKTVILSENREGWIYAFFSIWLNRGIAVPVDATATPDEVAYTLRDSEAECIWTSNKKLDTAREALRLLGRELPILIIDEHEQVELSDDIRPAKIDYESSATAVIIYTSGTTGSPKGVMLSFGNMMANVDSVSKEVRIYTQDRRAIILRLNPTFMQRCQHIIIDGRDYAAFGNLFLLRWARKVQVFCHRKAPDGHTPYEQTEAYRRECAEWKAQVMQGATVIVTPGISNGERIIKNRCIESGYPLIHIQKEPISRYWKPEASRFHACENGTLLILAPWSPETIGDVNGVPKETDYSIFHNLNKIAEEICTFNGTAVVKRK